MSRLIQVRNKSRQESVTYNDGKALVTRYKGCYLTLLVGDNRLLSANLSEEAGERIGSVYIGKIKNIIQNIEACFVEISGGELVFMPFSQCRTPFLLNRSFQGKLLEGDELLVQIEREAMKTKQAAVTAHVSISGRLLAFSLGSSRAGISSKISPDRRKELKQLLYSSKITDEAGNLISLQEDLPAFGIVIRTEAQNTSDEELLEEYRNSLEKFIAFLRAASHRTCFTCVHSGPKPYLSAISRFSSREYTEIVTDQPELVEELKQFNAPVRLYEDTSFPLSKLYSINARLEEAVNSRVWLKSGGYLVIEPTEALTVIDVNSGKIEGRKDKQDTFLYINLEAAEEIALQLRLRNLSGIIIIDFISMSSRKHQDQLMQHLKNLVGRDTMKTAVIDMTPLGLVEITRKKEWKTLKEQLQHSINEL